MNDTVERIKTAVEKELAAQNLQTEKSADFWKGYDQALDFVLWVIGKAKEGYTDAYFD